MMAGPRCAHFQTIMNLTASWEVEQKGAGKASPFQWRAVPRSTTHIRNQLLNTAGLKGLMTFDKDTAVRTFPNAD